MDKATTQQASAYALAYDHFNSKLFDGKLPDCMLTFTRNKSAIGGTFAPAKWRDSENPDKLIHEISLNSNIVSSTAVEEMFMILVHEMIHCWQYENGNPGAQGGHNKEYVAKCNELGLRCVTEKGGKKEYDKPGQAMSAEIIPGGAFESALFEMPDEALMPWVADPIPEDDRPAKAKKTNPNRSKKTYACIGCGIKVWGKTGLNFICGECNQKMEEVK